MNNKKRKKNKKQNGGEESSFRNVEVHRASISSSFCRNENNEVTITITLFVTFIAIAFYYFGDVDNDGNINTDDIRSVIDRNNDGKVSAGEVTTAGVFSCTTCVIIFVIIQMVVLYFVNMWLTKERKILDDKKNILDDKTKELNDNLKQQQIIKDGLNQKRIDEENHLKLRRQKMLKELEEKKIDEENHLKLRRQKMLKELEEEKKNEENHLKLRRQKMLKKLEVEKRNLGEEAMEIAKKKADKLIAVAKLREEKAKNILKDALHQKKAAVQEKNDAVNDRKEIIKNITKDVELQVQNVLQIHQAQLNVIKNMKNAQEARLIAMGAEPCMFCHKSVASQTNLPCHHTILCLDCSTTYRNSAKTFNRCPVDECQLVTTIQNKANDVTYIKCSQCHFYWESVYEFKVSNDCNHLICVSSFFIYIFYPRYPFI